MTAKEIEKLVREVCEPRGVELMTDDGMCVFRADFIDGWLVNLRVKGSEDYWEFIVEHTTSEADVRAGLESHVHDMLTS